MSPQQIGMLVGVAVALVIVTFRARRSMQHRRLRLEWLWVTPAILFAMAAFTLVTYPPAGMTQWLYLALAFAAGSALGWQRGRMMSITVDPQTHELNQQASPGAVIFLVLLLLVRVGARSALTAQAGSLHVSAGLITDVFLLFAIGLLGVTRLEMFLRGRRLLTEARAAKAAAA